MAPNAPDLDTTPATHGATSTASQPRHDAPGQGLPDTPPVAAAAAAAANASSAPAANRAPDSQSKPARRQKLCRYYGTAQDDHDPSHFCAEEEVGCRDGSGCRFAHDESRAAGTRQQEHLPSTAQRRTLPDPQSTSNAAPDPTPPDLAVRRSRPFVSEVVSEDRAVRRPIPRAEKEDPRAFQLQQLRRRYAPVEHDADGVTVLELALAPSDPDFPYDLDKLQCALSIPFDYPASRARLRVRNKDMPRGYQINVEHGFDDLSLERPQATLLQLMNLLDRRLEQLLTAPKAETIKLVANLGKPAEGGAAKRTASKARAPSGDVERQPLEATFTPDQLAQAAQIRNAEIRQLEARLGRMPLFSKAADGITFTVPIEPRRRSELPPAMQAVKAVKLTVPRRYNLEQCAIELVGIESEEACRVEAAFYNHVSDSSHLTLLNHMNYLAQHMHTMAQQPPPQSNTVTTSPRQAASIQTQTDLEGTVEIHDREDDRAHIIRIPRPPEWTVDVANDSGDSYDYSYDSGDDTEGQDDESHERGDEQQQQPTTSLAERGILVSFPHMELYGIELLELVALSITVKCDRCKDTQDVANLKNNDKSDYSGMRSVSCKKCANHLSIGYRMDLLHANSVRAGYLDLDGCTVVDLLPSNFVPTCSECSAPHPAPGVVAVRGESAMAFCRECHRKMAFSVPEVKFLRVSANAVRSSRAPLRKKPKERLGIVAGQELPRRGRCSHYGKSYRWFRFSCCSKVFPCDKCHDAATDHPNEHANRMICGYCSREQNYDPETCRHCRATLTGKAGTGFWEGGKGTRDKNRMSRKDPRKYKRRPGTKPKA